jgi:hypothetical protein
MQRGSFRGRGYRKRYWNRVVKFEIDPEPESGAASSCHSVTALGVFYFALRFETELEMCFVQFDSDFHLRLHSEKLRHFVVHAPAAVAPRSRRPPFLLEMRPILHESSSRCTTVPTL